MIAYRYISIKRRPAGFTLIEILVALAVIGIALTAAVSATGQLAAQEERLRLQQLAGLCAENTFAEIKLREGFPATGERQIECTQDGVTLKATVSILPTPNPNFRRLQSRWATPSGDPLITLTAIAGAI
jgi:general secretion pathway protein I